MSEVKCPACGSPAVLSRDGSSCGEDSFVICCRCGRKGFAETMEGAWAVFRR